MPNVKKPIYYPRNTADIPAYLTHLADKISGAIGTKYGTDPAVIAQLNSHKTQVPTKIKKAYDDRVAAKASTAAKKTELAEAKVTAMRELSRITSLAQWDENDGEALGIRKTKAEKDLRTMKPIVTSMVSLPDKILIKWAKKGMDAVIIEVLLASGKWEKLDEDMHSPYEDTRLNQTNQPENRFYRLRYVKNDKPIGQYSEIVHVVAEIYPVAE